MKKILLFIIFILLLFSCEIPTNEKTIIEKYNLPNGVVIKQIWPDPDRSILSYSNSLLQKTQPIKTKDEYFADGIMYKDNSYPVSEGGDGIIHTLDLSDAVQNKSSIVYFLVEWNSGCLDETFTAWFKPHDYNVEYEAASCRYGNPSSMAVTITDSNCIIDWYHNYTWNFEQSGVNKEIGIIVYAIFYTNGDIIPNS